MFTLSSDHSSRMFSDIQGPVELTRALIKEHTVSSSIDPTFVERFSEWLKRVGFAVTAVDTDGVCHLRATIGPEDPKLRVAFVGHYDTVPFGDGWSCGPLEAVEKEGVLYGRGASDMKSGDAAMIFAAMELAQEGVHSTVFLPGDEEVGSFGMPRLLEDLPYTFDCCIGGEPTSIDKLGDCLKIGRRGRVVGVITLHGEAGHAAYAERTPNIVNRLSEVIPVLRAAWNDARYGVETTLSITDIKTDSTADNSIPATVFVRFDARFAPGKESREIEVEISERLRRTGVSFNLTVERRSSSYLTDIDPGSDSLQSRFVRCAVAEIESSLGISPQISCTGGTSDARFVAERGVPTFEFGVPHGRMHGADEFVETMGIDRLRAVYVGVIRRYRDLLSR